MSTQTISLRQAILININVMLGTGIFINTVNLAKIAGAFGFLSYVIVAALLAPLIICIGKQLKRYPTGGFYDYAAYDIAPSAGFLSSWAYFCGKLASATLLIHVFVSLLKTIFPALTPINSYLLDSSILVLFTLITLRGIKVGMQVIYFFIFCKLLPVITLILSCIYLYNFWDIPAQTLLIEGIPSTLPLVLYAFVGFEVCCSISRSIVNAEKNGPKALFYSFAIIIFLNVLWQSLAFLTLNTELMHLPSYLSLFPTLLQNLIVNHQMLLHHTVNIIHIAASVAALGGSYGILFSNHWNIYTLALAQHLFFAKKFITLNKQGIPYLGVFLEMIFCFMYLYFTKAEQIALQQISVLGCIIAYTMSVMGLMVALRTKKYTEIKSWIVIAGLGSCLLLTGAVIRNFILNGVGALIGFSVILIAGIIMYIITKKFTRSQHYQSNQT